MRFNLATAGIFVKWKIRHLHALFDGFDDGLRGVAMNRNPQTSGQEGEGACFGDLETRRPGSRQAGSLMMKVVPSPGMLSAEMSPWWASTILYEMERPRPEPLARVV